MAVKSLIESPATSSEENSSSHEDHLLKKRKRESESEETDEDDSEEEESDESEDSDPRPQSVRNPTEKVQKEGHGLSKVSESEEEESDESEDLDPRPQSVRNPTEKVRKEGHGRSKESESEEEESDESEDSGAKPTSVSENPTGKVPEEDDGGSEESDSEEEESDQEEKSNDPKPGNKGMKKSQSEIASPSANSIQIKTGGGDRKKDFFQRLWSLEDEKALLNSILQFRLEKGKEVDNSSMEYFCDFLNGKLSFTDKPKPRQVSHKIRALKKKYSGTRFTKEHDLEMKEIATRVWELDVKSKSLKRKFSLLEEEVGKLKIPALKKKLKFGDNVEKAEALEQKIRKQRNLELKQELKRIDLIRETFKLILEGIEKV